MIVDPYFFEHWKTRELIRLTGDPSAPLFILKLWAHCQQRRRWRLDIPDAALAMICGWTGEPQKLREIFLELRFIDPSSNGILIVHEWRKFNRYLVSAWANGRKGGRKHKTDRLPVGKRSGTDRQPVTSSLVLSSNKHTEGDSKGKQTISAETIYDAYPHKVGKPAALRAITACMRTFDPAMILARTIAFAEARNGDRSFLPHPATFFNQHRFNDDPETWVRETQGKPKKPTEQDEADKWFEKTYGKK
jgi:hypothetical protein